MIRSPSSPGCPPLWLIGALAFFLPGIGFAQQQGKLQTWTNRNDQKIRAEVVGYDLETRTVQFRSGDAGDFNYPLRDLDWKSRLRALGTAAAVRSLYEQGWQPPAGYFLRAGLIWLIALMGSSMAVGFGSFWAAARLISGERDLARHISGFIKYLYTNVFIAIVLYLILMATIMAGAISTLGPTLRGAPGPPGLASPTPAVFLALQTFAWLILAFTIHRHYQLGFARSLVFLALKGVFAILLAALLIGGSIALLVFVWNQPDLADHAVNAWLLEPLGLL